MTLRLPKVSFDVAVALVLVFASGVGAVLQGQDANLDLYRYRLYIGYAFVHQRLDTDLVPAALGTFLNPVLDSVHYIGIRHLPPRFVGFLLGAFQGLNSVLVFLLARRLLPARGASCLQAVMAGVLAAAGPTARSLLGTTLGDTTVSVPALLALLLLVLGQASPKRGSALLYLMGAGFLGGAAMGLKLTMAPALVALLSLVVLGVARMRIPAGTALACLAGSVLGYLTVAGYWCWQLWLRFRNPIFPFVNQVFLSPYLAAEPVRDSRWAAHGVMDFLSPPVDMALGMTERLQEIPFQDARWLLASLAAIAWVGLRLARKRPPLLPGQRSVLTYAAVSYVVWALAFYYYRYAAVLEFLAPLALVLLIHAVLPKRAHAVMIGAFSLVLVTSSVGSWGRLPWGERWFNIRLPPQAYEPDSLVLVDSSLSSFLIPYFPGQTRFAGLEGTGSTRFEELVAARIAAHRGALFWLVSRGRPAPSASPERFGLAATDDCGLIRTGEGRWALCRVARAPGPRP